MILRRMRVCSTCRKMRSARWMPRWMEPVIPHLHLEASPAAEEAAPEPAHRRLRPLGRATRGAVPAQARKTHVGLDPGQARIAASAGLNGNRDSGPGRRRLTTATSPIRAANRALTEA